jgi:hypothetical protein
MVGVQCREMFREAFVRDFNFEPFRRNHTRSYDSAHFLELTNNALWLGNHVGALGLK